MRARGALLIAAGLTAAAIAYALRKASHDVADSFTDWNDPVLPAGTYGFVPVNSFDQLRSVEGFYSPDWISAANREEDALRNAVLGLESIPRDPVRRSKLARLLGAHQFHAAPLDNERQ